MWGLRGWCSSQNAGFAGMVLSPEWGFVLPRTGWGQQALPFAFSRRGGDAAKKTRSGTGGGVASAPGGMRRPVFRCTASSLRPPGLWSVPPSPRIRRIQQDPRGDASAGGGGGREQRERMQKESPPPDALASSSSPSPQSGARDPPGFPRSPRSVAPAPPGGTGPAPSGRGQQGPARLQRGALGASPSLPYRGKVGKKEMVERW